MPATRPPVTPPTGQPRPITFAPNQQEQFKQRTLLIAWLCQRDGGWKNSNVTDHVRKLLQREGMHVPHSHVKLSFEWLVKQEYAITVVYAKRTREFILAPDVQVQVPSLIAAKTARAVRASTPPPFVPAEEPLELPEEQAVTNGHAPAARKAPPLPRQPIDPRLSGWNDDVARLVGLLRMWWIDDPDAAEKWLADAREALDA